MKKYLNISGLIYYMNKITAKLNKKASLSESFQTKIFDGDLIVIDSIPSQSNKLTYNDSSLSPTWNNYDIDQLAISGYTNGVNAGIYTAIFTPKEGYKWSDGSTIGKSVTWKISRAIISNIPSKSNTMVHPYLLHGIITIVIKCY